MILMELKELRRLLEGKEKSESFVYVNHLSEIERLVHANSRLEDEIAELQKREEEVISRKWW
jgi:hypothetical protein